MKSYEAYQMYMQGFPHKEIGDYLGFDAAYSRQLVRNYALRNNLPYPRKQVDHSKTYDLYYNGMSVRDIARFYNIGERAVLVRIKKFCVENRVEMPTEKERPRIAYELRIKYNFTYAKIARMVGYANKSNCFRAIKKYKEENQC